MFDFSGGSRCLVQGVCIPHSFDHELCAKRIHFDIAPEARLSLSSLADAENYEGDRIARIKRQFVIIFLVSNVK